MRLSKGFGLISILFLSTFFIQCNESEPALEKVIDTNLTINPDDFSLSIPYDFRLSSTQFSQGYSELLQTDFLEYKISWTTSFNPSDLATQNPERLAITDYTIIAVPTNSTYEYYAAKFTQPRDIATTKHSLNDLKDYTGTLEFLKTNGQTLASFEFRNGESWIVKELKGQKNSRMPDPGCYERVTQVYLELEICNPDCNFATFMHIGSVTDQICPYGDQSNNGGGSGSGETTTVYDFKNIKVYDNVSNLLEICPQSFNFTTVGNSLKVQVGHINNNFAVKRGSYVYNTHTFISPLCITLSGSTDKNYIGNILRTAWIEADNDILQAIINGSSFTVSQANSMFKTKLKQYLLASGAPLSNVTLTSGCSNVTTTKAIYADDYNSCN